MFTGRFGGRVRNGSSIGLGLVVALALLSPMTAYAADPPANDRFADARLVDDFATPLPAVDLAAAGWEVDERWPCGTQANTVWYRFTYGSTNNGAVQVDAPGARVTAFYLPSGSTLKDLSSGYCKGTSTLLIPWIANRTDYVQIANDGAAEPITVTFSLVPPPPNDDLAQAQSVALGASTLEADTTVDTRTATVERMVGDPTRPAAYDIPRCFTSSFSFGRSVWYAFVPDQAGRLRIDPADSSFPDVTLTAYQGYPTPASRVACASSRTPVTFTVLPWTVYYIQAVDAVSPIGALSGGGTLELAWSLDVAPDVPPVLTLPASMTVEATGPAGAHVTFSVSAFDAVDGALPDTCNPPSGSTFLIGTTFISCRASDSAGNAVGGGFWVTVRDTVAPSVMYASHPDAYTVADTIDIPCTASDVVGVGISTCAAIDGFGWEFGLGLHEFGAMAIDAAGNQGSASTAFTVVATYGSMSDLTKQWVSKAGVAKDLVAILDSAAAAEARGQKQAEAGKLADYRALVLAQAGKSITTARAAMLVAFSSGL